MKIHYDRLCLCPYCGRFPRLATLEMREEAKYFYYCYMVGCSFLPPSSDEDDYKPKLEAIEEWNNLAKLHYKNKNSPFYRENVRKEF
jgi:hypothetical protein